MVETLESRQLLTAPVVATPTSATITAATATLGGDVTADGGSPITERGVVYSLTSDNANPEIGGANVVVVPEGGTTTGVFTVPVTGLTALSGYSFKAYAINGDGTSYSSVATFSTLEAPSFVVTTATDVVSGSDGLTSLREAITLANGTAGADTITFGDGSAIVGGTNFIDATADTITLLTGQLAITDSATITGTGTANLTVSGNNSSRVFNINDGLTVANNASPAANVTLSGLTITGGSSNSGGGIFVFEDNLTLLDSVVTGNASTGKGGDCLAMAST